MNAQILSSLLVIGLVAAAVGGATFAYFSDTEKSENNIIQAGKLDLIVNDQNGLLDPVLVELNDLKPSQDHYEEIELYIDNNPGWLWKHIEKDDAGVCITNGVTEPECTSQHGTWDSTGTCTFEGSYFDENNLYTVIDFDLSVTVGNTINNIILLENGITLDDVTSCWIPLGTTTFPGATDIIVTQSFHMQTDVGNWAQSDQCTVTEHFAVTQANDVDATTGDPNPPPSTSDRVWDADLMKCVDVIV